MVERGVGIGDESVCIGRRACDQWNDILRRFAERCVALRVGRATDPALYDAIKYRGSQLTCSSDTDVSITRQRSDVVVCE